MLLDSVHFNIFSTLVFLPVQLRSQLVVLHLLLNEPPQIIVSACNLLEAVRQDADNGADVLLKFVFIRCVSKHRDQTNESPG